MKDLIKIEQKPIIPTDWNYDGSVVKVKQYIYKWKNLTYELACELWIAREILSLCGGDRKSNQWDKSPVDKTWTDYCEDIDSSRRVINRWLNRWFELEELQQIATAPPLPLGKFSVIVIDPPWPYGTVYNPESRRVASPYSEMGLDELGALNIPSADDCILWLWVTNAFMHDAFHLLEVWGFEPKAILTWDKQRTGVGYWLRGQTEHCILAVKGDPQITHSAQGTLLSAKAKGHSTKPDAFYQLVESLCPGKKLEMFARRARNGWAVWGDEIKGG